MEPVVEVKQVEDTAALSSDQPRILYQCGDCEELFKSLHLWQQHRREEKCQQVASAAAPAPEQQQQPEQQALLIQNSQSVLSPEQSSLGTELKQEPPSEAEEKIPPEKTREKVAETLLPPSSEPLSEAAAPAADAEDSSLRKRGATKKTKPEPVLLCVDCGSCFGLVSELVAHRKTQHGFEEALHRCTVCGECFLNTTLFLYHRKQHKQLGEAAEAPQDAAELPTGVLTEQRGDGSAPLTGRDTPGVPETSSFLCTRCGESCGDGEELAAHRKQKHNLLEPLHSCHCGESFMNTTQYLYHRRQHTVPPGLGTADQNATGDEKSPGKPEDIPQSSKRQLSPSASSGEVFSPIPKRGRPSFSSLKGWYHTLSNRK